MNNARATDGHKELLGNEVGFYPPGFMPKELVDRIHGIITSFYEEDKIFVDKVAKYIARRLALATTVPIDPDVRTDDRYKILMSAVGMGCGIEGRLEVLAHLGLLVTLDEEGLRLMVGVEYTWRWERLLELCQIEEIWRRCGIAVEDAGVSLTALWLRLIKANDREVLDKIRAAENRAGEVARRLQEGGLKGKEKEDLQKELENALVLKRYLGDCLFSTAIQGAWDREKAAVVEQIRKELG